MSTELVLPRKGSYGLVELTKKTLDLTSDQRTRKFVDFFAGILFGQLKDTRKSYNMAEVARQVVIGRSININSIQGIPATDSMLDQERQAEILGGIETVYESGRQKSAEENPYQLGLMLSDFIELLPTSLAARILRSASNPDLALNDMEVRRRYGYVGGTNTQILATEAAVLLPRQIRQDVFVEMARIEPVFTARPYLFFRQIVGNFHDSRSPLCGLSLIYKNLEGEKAADKVLEVQEDFVPLGELMRAQFH